MGYERVNQLIIGNNDKVVPERIGESIHKLDSGSSPPGV